MANEAAWEQGFAIGSERGRERRAQKQELTDEERQNTYKMYADQLAALRTKLSMVPKDSKEYQDTFSALENTVGQIKDLYHPQKNPGAIEKFGHILTDALHITSPQVRQQEISSKLAASQADNKKEADLLASSAPLSPEQQAAIQTKNAIAQKQAESDWMVEWAKKNGLSDDAIEELKQHIVGLPYAKLVPLAGSKPYLGPDGRYYQTMRDAATGVFTEEPLPPNFKPSEKPIKGGLVRVKPGQSPTGFVELWLDQYNPQRVVGATPITPSRYYQTTSSTETDPFGVTSTRTTAPVNMTPVDISAYPIFTESGTALPTAPPSTSAEPNVQVQAPPPVTSKTPIHEPTKSASKSKEPSGAKQGEPSVTPTAASGSGLVLNPNGKNLPPLDANYHIPESLPINSSLREAANQLLDGIDIKELGIPPRDKAAAEALARRYGWGRGPYTPRELKQMQNANQFLDMVLDSKDFMKALDEGTFQKWKLAVAESDPSKEGMMGKLWHQIAVQNLSPQQQEYLRLRQSMLGTISGLSSVVRSGRATEATINRLIQEIPDVMSSNNAADAKARIANIKRELQLALRQGVPRPTKTGEMTPSTPQEVPPSSPEDNQQMIEDLRNKLLEHVKQ